MGVFRTIKKYQNRKIGILGEEKTVKYLEDLGYIILARNFNTYRGEIDIVAKDKDEYVFIEVKTRTSDNYGIPREAVNKKKKNHIIKSSEYFIYKYKLENRNIRFDVVEVYVYRNMCFINHIKNNFF